MLNLNKSSPQEADLEDVNGDQHILSVSSSSNENSFNIGNGNRLNGQIENKFKKIND